MHAYRGRNGVWYFFFFVCMTLTFINRDVNRVEHYDRPHLFISILLHSRSFSSLFHLIVPWICGLKLYFGAFSVLLLLRPRPEIRITKDKSQVAITILTPVNSALTEVNTKSTRDSIHAYLSNIHFCINTYTLTH